MQSWGKADAKTLCLYNSGIEFTWSESIRHINIKAHGLDFVGYSVFFRVHLNKPACQCAAVSVTAPGNTWWSKAIMSD